MSQKQNTNCSDLFESAANEAKRLKWSQDISAAQFELKRLQDEWDRKDKNIALLPSNQVKVGLGGDESKTIVAAVVAAV